MRTTLSLTALICVMAFQNCGGFTAASGEAPTAVTAFSSTDNGSTNNGSSVTVISGFIPVSTPSSVQQSDALAALQTAVLSEAALLNSQCSGTEQSACVMAALATEQAQNIAAAIATPGTAISVIAPFIPGIQTYVNEYQSSAP